MYSIGIFAYFSHRSHTIRKPEIEMMYCNRPINKLTIFLPILAAVFLISCAKDKTTVPARLYHNTTSLFNGYYNANELFKETVKQIEEQYEFTDEALMEVVYYGTEDEIKGHTSKFDEIIKKNDIVIFKHPNANYVDDCRFLNGKAWFYKQGYNLAMENFDEVLLNFPESDLIPEVMIWKAKAFYFLDNSEMTKTLLDENILYNDTIFLKKDVQTDLDLFMMRMAIDQDNHEAAAKLLEETVENIKGSGRRSRAHFLLGQLYEKANDYPRSLEHYTAVRKHTNDYDFVFKSKMKIARLYVNFQGGKDDDDEVYKYLNKLLRDEKNEEYRDQIYYEFALLELKKDSLNPALGFLRESIGASVSNQRQKALSYYKSGQIYFYNFQAYPEASAYYDSAAQAIAPTAPEYKEITRLAKTLKDYITCVNTIHFQDSMLYLAALPEAELDTLIENLFQEEKRKEEELARQAAEDAEKKSNNPNLYLLQDRYNQRNNRNNPGGGGGSSWYFDNPTAISNGKLEFESKWGPRKDEDNWRRKNKAQGFGDPSAAVADEQTEEVDSTLLEQYGDKYKYYKDIPKTEEEILAANLLIEESYYKLGQIYDQNLNEPDSAIVTYETLLDRYDDSEYTLRARYALYKLYLEQGNPLAEAQKNYIVNEHPQTVYAYLILGKDPKELRAVEEDFEYAYDGLFQAYKTGQYETSLGFSEYLMERFYDNPALEIPTMQYVRGMSYGYLGDKDSLRAILTRVVELYPEAEVTPSAKETLRLMEEGFSTIQLPGGSEAGTAGAAEGEPNADGVETVSQDDPRLQGFTKEIKASDKIYIMMFIPKSGLSQSEITNQVKQFNSASFKELNLKAFTFNYKQTHLLPYITHFKEVNTAKEYMKTFRETEYGAELLGREGASMFYLTQANFREAYGKKRIEDYVLYFGNVLEK